MPLKIRFTNKTCYEPGLARGQIVLDQFIEDFESSLALWSAERYEQQWEEGIDRLRRGASKSCLITSLWAVGPACEVWGVWWVLYNRGDHAVVRNRLLLSAVIGAKFDQDYPYGAVPEHRSFSPGGEAISEWVVGLDAPD